MNTTQPPHRTSLTKPCLARLAALILCCPTAPAAFAEVQKGEMFGSLLYDGERVPKEFNADLTPEEREVVQKRVERLHHAWTKDRTYLPPPDMGKLAEIDPALIVTPPRGLEVGYVPIATRQELD